MEILKRIWKAWRSFGHFMADVVGRVVMLVLYFTVVAPFGLAVRFFSDPLHMKGSAPAWEKREAEAATLESANRTY